MAAASEDRNTEYIGVAPFRVAVPVKTLKKIYAGTLVTTDASGYAMPATKATTQKAIGIAQEKADNSAGLSGAINVVVAVSPVIFKMTMSTVGTTGTFAQTKIGSTCYVVDDQHLATSNATAQTANNAFGTVLKYASSTEAWIKF